MRRYWIESEFFSHGEVVLANDIFHHICEVCRQEVGSRFEVLNEKGQAFLVEIHTLNKKSALARILEVRNLPLLPKPHLHLNLCFPRFPVFESIVEKSVELGVKSIQPLYSDFSFIRSSSALSASKWIRWQKIIKSAMQQSGRGESMELKEPQPLADFLQTQALQEKQDASSQDLHLFAYEGVADQSLKGALKKVLAPSPKNIHVFVGGEGGFSTSEVTRFRSLGMQALTLGDQVLRVETACISLLAILRYEFIEQDLAGGKHVASTSGAP